MSSFFKGLGLLVALSCLVWVGVIWHWQSSQRDMSVEDVLVYLGALPLVVFGLVLLARWAVRRAATSAAAGPAAQAALASAAAPAAPGADVAARTQAWQLLSAHGHTRLGTVPADWAAAAAAHAPAPGLDDELRDQQGLPVMAARVPDLELDDVEVELEGPVAAARVQHADLQVGTAFKRALALMRAPLAAAVTDLAPWSARLSQTPDGAASARVRVLVAWPLEANALELEAASAWLQQRLAEAGEGLVAPQRWSLVPAAPGGLAGVQLWAQADTLFEAMRRDERQDLVLLLAAHSDVADDVVARLDAAGKLFSAARPKGCMPGEAATALLLAPQAWARSSPDDEPPALLHRAAIGQREKPVDGAGRIAHTVLPDLLQQALKASGADAAAIGHVANDADQHTPRGAELFGALVAALPHLDAAEDVLTLGSLTGSLGACGPLLAAAVAAHHATRTGQPGLCLSVADPVWRLALLARPGMPDAADAAAAVVAQASAAPTPSPA